MARCSNSRRRASGLRPSCGVMIDGARTTPGPFATFRQDRMSLGAGSWADLPPACPPQTDNANRAQQTFYVLATPTAI